MLHQIDEKVNILAGDKDGQIEAGSAAADDIPPIPPAPEFLSKIENFPAEARMMKHWVCWQYVWKDGRWTKEPRKPKNGHRASSTNPDHWTSLQEAMDGWKRNELSGIGFVLTNSGFTGIDFDHCRFVETGQIEEWAMQEIEALRSYTEISPSYTGIHVLAKAQLPGKGFNKKKREIYGPGIHKRERIPLAVS